MDHEHRARMIAKLYECRDAARTLLGEKYPERMAEYGKEIRAVAINKKITDIKAAILLSSIPAASRVGSLLYLAALVEMIEPSKQERKHDAH